MKKTLWIVGALLLGAWVVSGQNQPEPESDELLLRNIEALAGNEGTKPVLCFGSGDVDCPYSDVNVDFVGEWFSLRP